MNEDHTKAFAMASQIMLIELFGAIITKGLLSVSEGKELIDRCLLNFETQSALAAPDNTEATRLARAIFERLLAKLSLPPSNHPERNQ
jgi:hypothetical protein